MQIPRSRNVRLMWKEFIEGGLKLRRAGMEQQIYTKKISAVVTGLVPWKGKSNIMQAKDLCMRTRSTAY